VNRRRNTIVVVVALVALVGVMVAQRRRLEVLGMMSLPIAIARRCAKDGGIPAFFAP